MPQRRFSKDSQSRSKPPVSFGHLAWRWHFYAGLFVIPLLLTLALIAALGLALPLVGASLLAIWALDWLLLSRLAVSRPLAGG